MLNKRNIQILFILFIICSIPIIFWSNSDIKNKNFDDDKNEPIQDLDSPIKLSSYPPNYKYFNYYKEITINNGEVAEDLTNFPLLVSIIDSDLHTKAQADGDDIAFSNGSDWLDYEIELFDPSYSGTEAKLVAWVEVPSVSSSTDTKIYMYYGNSTMVSQQNPSGVWNSNYKAVWHLNTTSQGPNTLLDSTSNDNDGTNYQADDGSAYIVNGRDYDGSNDYSNMGSRSSIDNLFNGGATISAWIYPEGWGGASYGRIIDKSTTTGGTNGWVMCLDGVVNVPNQLLFYRDFSDNRGLWYTGTDTISLGQWQHVVVCYDEGSTSNDPIIFINGVSQTITEDIGETPDGVATNDAAQDLYIGNFMGGGRGFEGIIDEVRLSKGIRSSGWIQTEFNNQNDPSSFYTVGTEISLDTIPPDITINSPSNNSLIGSVAPDFNVKINDSKVIDKSWYRLLNGTITTANTTFTTNGTINQARWNELGNGTVTIQFFANDSSGNIGFSEVTVRKDIRNPAIIINTPNHFELFGMTAPDFNVETYDVNGVDKMWYTLDNGPEIFFTTNGSISSTVWSNCGNGTVSIKFYANDSVGNTGFSEVIVRKEVNSPSIKINSPNSHEIFGKIAPNFNVLIKDNYTINDMWYTLNNGIETYFATNGTISQSAWNAWGNGTVSIKFYANNSLGNGAFEEVIVRKDVINPTITINSPDDYDLFGKSAPPYNVEITDINGIDTRWYTLDGGNTNTTFISNGYINQDRWNDVGSGTILIRFYANDTLGNVGFSDVYVDKDIDNPIININSPTPYQLCGADAPSFNINVLDVSIINLMWYTIDGGLTNITFSKNGTISELLWDSKANGTVTIAFYAEDSLGNEGFSEVTVRKDIDPPEILINNPFSDQVFGVTAPVFNVQITDINGIDTMWYSFDGGLTNTIFTTNGSINQAIWDDLGDGEITLQFYANNSIGTTGYSEVSIIKDMYAPKITINSPNDNLYCKEAPIINIYAFDINFDKLWCEIGSNTIFLTNNVDFEINSSIWDDLPEGFFQVFIYANDTVGHLNDTIVLDFCKDTIVPNAPILTTYPIGEVSLPIIFDWEEVSDDSGIDYYRLIIDNEQDPLATPGFTFEVTITNNGSESSYYELLEYLVPRNYYFFIYQIDMAGNQGHAASGTFTIQGSSGPVTEFPWWIILVIAIPLGLAIVVIGLKKSKKKSVQVVIIDKELDKMKEKRKVLEEEAKIYIKEHNYVKAAEIYDECAKISSHLYNEGDKVEQYKYKEYKRLELDANSQAEAIPLKNDCINNLITKYFDENGIKYYSNPQIYPEEDGIVSGLILNDNGLLQNRFTKLNDGSDLANQLQVDTAKLESINAIQFLFTDNLSVDSLVEYCQKFQNPEMMLLIIGIEWPSYHYDDIIPVPKGKDIKFHENIKIINLDLFSKIMLIDEKYKMKLNEIVDLKNDLNALENLYNATKIQLHDTNELKDELKQKGWFFLI